MLTNEKIQELKQRALSVRKSILTMVHQAHSGHIGGSLGSADLLVTLYFHIMNHDPERPNWTERDRFILSKGHCTPVLYAVLAECGYFPQEDLATFRRPGSHLQGHPYQPKTPGVEASTGTLGLGISTGVGMALGAKLKQQSQYYYILCGDGEIQEGQAWEAAMFANKYRLNNVIAFTDRNYLQTDGHSEQVMPLDPLVPKWESFGWKVYEMDGHNIPQMVETISDAQKADVPVMIVTYTTKGKGVAFMEDQAIWHGKPPSDEEFERAISELEL